MESVINPRIDIRLINLIIGFQRRLVSRPALVDSGVQFREVPSRGMSETTPLIKAALNLRVGVGFDVYD